MGRKIKYGTKSRDSIIKGVEKLSKAVISTLGPNGRNVIISTNGSIRSTKDGVSVAKEIELDNVTENLGAQLIKQASIKTSDSAGDGTTTSTLLASEMVKMGMEALNVKGMNAVQIKRDIDKAVQIVVENLKKLSKDISNESQLEQIAYISSNNDKKAGKLISTAIKKVGSEGIIHIEEAFNDQDSLETVEGIQFNRGYQSHHFVTNKEKMSVGLKKPKILLVDGKLNNVKELLPLFEKISQDNDSLLIIAEDIVGEALATLIVNKVRGTLKVCAVKAPDFGERRKLILEDIAILTGGTVVDRNKGMSFDEFDADWLGEARNVTITKDQSTIIDGKGKAKEINKRVKEIKSQLDSAKTPFETEKLQERLANFTGGVVIIHVGGKTETEIGEKKDRMDDAVNATRAAIQEGIIPGGGIALLSSRKGINTSEVGGQVVWQACQKPFIQILLNAGYPKEEIMDILNKIEGEETEGEWEGFNIKTEEIVDMLEEGIIDPTKVCRTALENAASVAGTILLTECSIVDKKSESQAVNPMMGMM